MQLIKTTAEHHIYLDFFEGIPIRILKDIKTNEISFFAEDVAKALDYDSLENFMGSDEVLDMMNEVHSETGSYPIYAIDINQSHSKKE
jgi:prophage antirepressor-like protein